jgi:hypothetical protein
LLLALERRRIAHPKAQDYACFQRGLQQRIAIGEMGFNINLRFNEHCVARNLGSRALTSVRELPPVRRRANGDRS